MQILLCAERFSSLLHSSLLRLHNLLDQISNRKSWKTDDINSEADANSYGDENKAIFPLKIDDAIPSKLKAARRYDDMVKHPENLQTGVEVIIRVSRT